MKAIAKKLKEKKRSEVDKIKEIAATYPVVHVVLNSDIPNKAIQQIRGDVRGRVVFVKKSMFQREYPAFQFSENYFLVLAAGNIQEALEATAFPDYIEAGGVAAQHVAVPAGVVKNERLAELLDETVMQGANTILLKEFVVCNEGDVVGEKQAKILRVLGKRLREGRLKVLAVRELADSD